MKEQIFMAYETPQVEMIEVQVEQGFAVSEGDGFIDDVPYGGGF